MKFSDLQFRHKSPQYPWTESKMERQAFKDCRVRASISEIGSHYECEDKADLVRVTAYYDTRGGLVDEHARAFDGFMGNIGSIETRALSCLYDIAKEVVKEALISHSSPGFDRFARGLPEFIAKYRLDSAEGIVNQVSWFGLSLFDHGFEGQGCITLDFHCGWDEEHGVSLLMHGTRLIAVSSMGDFTNRGNSVIAHASYLQRRCRSPYDIAV